MTSAIYLVVLGRWASVGHTVNNSIIGLSSQTLVVHKTIIVDSGIS